MKKILTSIHYIVLALVLVVGFSMYTNAASAAFSYTSGEVPYQVVAGNLPPVVEAGPSHVIPNSSWTIPTGDAYAHDPNGDATIVSQVWTQTGGPAASITNGNAYVPTFYNLNSVGVVYTFTLTVTDDHGATASDFMTVTVNPVSGPVAAVCSSTVNSCTTGTYANDGVQSGTTWTWTCNGISGGANASCSASSGPASVNGQCNNSINNSCTSGTYAGDGQQVGQNWTWTCSGSNGGSNASCTKSSPVTVNGQCNNGVINGCTAGLSSPNSHSGTDPWTWSCLGTGPGATNATNCSHAYGGVTRECSDSSDNEGDTFIDMNDPSCHTDCRATNPASYDPTLDNEAKKCNKITEIEI